jgi:hypothetical protein
VHLGAYSLIGEELEQHGVAHPTVDDVHLSYAAAERFQAAVDLGNHAALHHARLDQPSRLAGGEGG